MIRNKKAMLFCSQMILTGALMTGAPCLVFGDNTQTSEISQISDHSGEGQIHNPEHLETPDFTSDPNFIDDSTDNTAGYYTILVTTTVSLDQMTSQYNSHGQEYPSAALKEGGAETIEDFCTIILEEANAEGIRGEVVFEQAMLETGWLAYGGDSGIFQYYFAGLGTTGGGVQDCVDTRYDMVRRGSAPYVEWLGQQENPNGGGWAAGADYGAKLIRLLGELKEK